MLALTDRHARKPITGWRAAFWVLVAAPLACMLDALIDGVRNLWQRTRPDEECHCGHDHGVSEGTCDHCHWCQRELLRQVQRPAAT